MSWNPYLPLMTSIASWNVRGLNWPNKQEDVKLFLQLNNIGLIGLLETKVKSQNVCKIAENIFTGWEWANNCAISNGRIWVAWKPSLYKVSVKEQSDQFIHCSVSQLLTSKHFHITFIYGHNHEPQRQPMWTALHRISTSIQGAWCILGDFNAILSKDDRIGGDTVSDHDIQELSNFMEDCEVLEMPSTGPFFSWTNKTIWSRIDRVFINILWHEVFDYTIAKYLPQGLSDHTPILVHFHTSPKPPHQFQFCDMWSSHQDFQDIVLSGLPDSSSPDILRLTRVYLSQQRNRLRHLNHSRFNDLRRQQEIARDRLLQLQQVLQHSPDSDYLKALEKDARNHYISILTSSLSLLKQQCKIDWINYGDDSTRFFYARAKHRKLASYIFSIQNTTGEVVEGFDKVGDVLLSYYKDLLGQTPLHRQKLDASILSLGALLNQEQQIDLCKPFSDLEIKEAMFSIPNHKSPGPDGFSSGFFKSSWNHTGPMVCGIVRRFLLTGHMPLFLSATKLIVLPKVTHPQKASDFRPISCCNVLYKVISKLLCSRLKVALPYLINQCQGAFVPGREIIFNVLICQDLARGYNRKHISPRCMMKIDLHKAFDSIHWHFVEDLLHALHFPKIFTKWIMACVSNVEFSLHLNGQIHGSFKGRRGLRQGDPLSPLLFVLTMEYFSRIMLKTSGHPHFKFHPHCKPLNLTHLMFADDLILFGKADVPTIRIMKEALDSFSQSTGLVANLLKSQIFLGGCSTSLHNHCLQVADFPEGSLPMMYLGIPITASRLSNLECSNLVEKITARVHIWATKNLSFAGRSMLINGVIFGMFNYWASIFLLPQKVLDKLTSICRNFLWGGKIDSSKIPYISWATTCKAKKNGGAGIKDFKAWNKATIAKLVWAIANKKDSLWVKWVHGRYIREKDWWEYTPLLTVAGHGRRYAA